MDNKTPVNMLIRSKQFKKQIADYFDVNQPSTLSVEQFGRGFSKIVWKISSPDLPRDFLVKEIRFLASLESPSFDDAREIKETNASLVPEQAFYELETIMKIARSPGLRDQFSKNIGIFASLHPRNDNDMGEIIGIDKAKRNIDAEQDVSLFIVEEIIKGQRPTEEQEMQAKAMRRQGMKTNPRIWLTVDTDPCDFLVRDDGSFGFFDVGHFGHSRAEEKMFERFTSNNHHR